MVDYATADGTALAGTNYTATTGTVTFAPGEARKNVDITVIDDGTGAGTRAFTLRFTNMRGCGSESEGDTTVNGRIHDVTPTATIADAEAHESGDGTVSKMFFTVRVQRAKPGETYIFNVATTNEVVNTAGSTATPSGPNRDYIPISTTISVPGNTGTARVSVDIIDDNIQDSGEKFRIRLLGVAEGSAHAQISTTQGFATGTILNHDPDAALTAEFANLPNENPGQANLFTFDRLQRGAEQRVESHPQRIVGARRAGPARGTKDQRHRSRLERHRQPHVQRRNHAHPLGA